MRNEHKSVIVAILCCGLWSYSCGPAAVSAYSRQRQNAAVVRPTTDQKKVLDTTGGPSSVWKGPWETTVWVYCRGHNQKYWVEFDSNGRMLAEGDSRSDIPHGCAAIDPVHPM